ncbi:hypothetical protein QTO34_014690 [Cnephaeus nilssonii]|uniref:Protein FAM32A n=1 Tax=Cnephaeus nilssonii TaxID=3371016 RepID=A0AA40LSI4_CNENI|nr:hypothetical protein QTO34_014690 [Eptesicus nilssonii]
MCRNRGWYDQVEEDKEGCVKLLEAIRTSKKNKEKKWQGQDKLTLAQVAFEKIQEKWQMERILKKAPQTHKQRVEDFNRHLDILTEHYDIPKVSWTKSPPHPDVVDLVDTSPNGFQC